MKFRKDIIIISGGKNKGVVKLGNHTEKHGYLKGSCCLDFRPTNGKLYIIGDKIFEIILTGSDTDFELPECGTPVSCVVLSALPPLFGATEGGKCRGESISTAENWVKHRADERAKKSAPQGIAGDAYRQQRSNSDNNPHEYAKTDSKNTCSKETDAAFYPLDRNISSNSDNIKGNSSSDRASSRNSNDNSDNVKDSSSSDRASSRNSNDNSDNVKDSSFTSTAAQSGLSSFDEGVRYDGNNFYLAVKPQIDEMFICYPLEPRLSEAVPNSKWVRIDTDDDYYVVGLLYDGDAPSFICYGIPGKFSVKPPRDLADMCVWLPIQADDKYNCEGYWAIYQSAVSGSIVR